MWRVNLASWVVSSKRTIIIWEINSFESSSGKHCNFNNNYIWNLKMLKTAAWKFLRWKVRKVYYNWRINLGKIPSRKDINRERVYQNLYKKNLRKYNDFVITAFITAFRQNLLSLTGLRLFPNYNKDGFTSSESLRIRIGKER